ncbi:beta strand repeat-containing protein [Dietzia alimentaria]|uniref:beta strand repeat-containing protein n=1 Tax=Dietzia alimentaria TaxID=665550 RepID=UPI00029A307F|nr:Ig-like domain repeat protein [Dietzia alimentaria]
MSEATPTYGDEVTVSTNITRNDYGHLLYRVRDFTPACMEFVPGSATANKPEEPTGNNELVDWSSGIGRQATPFTMTAKYRVMCNAGQVATGGTWMGRGGSDELGDRNMGPAINVQRKATTTSIGQPSATVIGQPTALSATTNAPNGTQVEFLVNESVVGSSPSANGAATYNWTAPTPGSFDVRARTVQTATHAGSTSAVVTAEVVQSESTVNVSAASPAMAGSPVPLTATTNGIADGQPIEFLVNNQQLGTAEVTAGSATYTGWAPDIPGSYTIQARYSGSTTVAGSSSGQVNVDVIDPVQQTSTTLDVNPDPAPGQPSTLTATVVAGNDGDEVQFANSGAVLGTSKLVEGVATYDWVPSAAQANQPYSLTARYLGSPGYAESTSTPVTGTIGLIQTSVSPVTAPGTATVGTSVPLTATVTGGTAGERIEFRNGADELCSATLSGGGTATCYWTPQETGDYQVTAHYPGTATTTPAASPSATPVTVQLVETSLELAGPSTATIGQATTLTVETTGIADGETVSLQIDGDEVDTAQVASDQASFQWTPTATGSYESLAVYEGSATAGPAQSDPLVVEVGLTQTQTSAVTASASPVTGEPVTLSATVTDGTEGATVEFREGITVLCTGEVAADGTVSCPWTPDQLGDVAVTAHYLGDATTAPSQSPAPTTVTVGQGQVSAPSDLTVAPQAPAADDAVTVSGTAPADSTVTVTATDGQQCTAAADAEGAFTCELGVLPVGEQTITAVATLNGVDSGPATTSVTVSATASSVELSGPTSVQPGETAELTITTNGIADGESVDILIDETFVDSATVTGGEATYEWTATQVGSFTIRADYGGSGTASPAESNELTITVDAAATQTSRVTASSTTGSIGQPVTLSSRVTNGTGGVDVEFRNGTAVLCTGQLAADGTVDCEWEPAAAGTVNVIAHYEGDATTNPSQSPRATTVSVDRTASSLSLDAPNAVEVGQELTFTVTTVGISDGQTVDITAGGTRVGSPTVTGGQATYTWTAPAVAGTVTAIASYAGNDTVAPSESEPVGIDVGVAATATSNVVASSEATVGEPVTLAATVTGGTEGATIEFRDGATVLCDGELSADGTVSCEWTPLAEGTVDVTAYYPGDEATGASQSATATTITVAEAPDTEAPAAPTSIVVAPEPVTAGQPVTVTGEAEAGSTVKVTVDGQQVCETIATGGTFSCEFDATLAMDGERVTVTATDAAGNTSEPADGGTLVVDDVVDPTEPTITLMPANPVAGEPVTLTITGDEGEQVVVLAGTTEVCRTTIGADGTATCEWTPESEGAVTLQVTVGDRTIEKPVTVRPAGDDDGNGSLDAGSLGNLFGGSSGSSGSTGSLGSLGS